MSSNEKCLGWDMACDTFLKIVQKCKRKFVIIQIILESIGLPVGQAHIRLIGKNSIPSNGKIFQMDKCLQICLGSVTSRCCFIARLFRATDTGERSLPEQMIDSYLEIFMEYLVDIAPQSPDVLWVVGIFILLCLSKCLLILSALFWHIFCDSAYVGETEPFVSELLNGLATTIVDLEPHQIHAFYESVGHMIQAESDPPKRDEYLQRLMVLPNQKWAEIIGQARQSVDYLKDQDAIRTVLNILQTNTSVASALGTYFLPQISLIFLDMLNIYSYNAHLGFLEDIKSGVISVYSGCSLFFGIMYSELISLSIAEGGPFASKTSFVKLLRSVKRETLKLIETFVDKAEDQPQIGKQFIPPMTDPVLGDYARNVPDARESEVLSLFATIINKYSLSPYYLLDCQDCWYYTYTYNGCALCTPLAVFDLQMITKNFEDYPEHRLKFFSLLRAIATHCFRALFALSSQWLSRLRMLDAWFLAVQTDIRCFVIVLHYCICTAAVPLYLLEYDIIYATAINLGWRCLRHSHKFMVVSIIPIHCLGCTTLFASQLKLVMDSIIWAFRHTERNVAETGLNLLLEMLKNFQVSEFCNQFHQSYFLTVEQEIFAVLTDTFHKPGFKLHVLILQHLFCLVDSGALTEPLWDVAALGSTAYPNNMIFVHEYTIKLLGTSFPNMTASEVKLFVDGLFESRNELSSFKNHIRDFLVQSKEFSAQRKQLLKEIKNGSGCLVFLDSLLPMNCKMRWWTHNLYDRRNLDSVQCIVHSLSALLPELSITASDTSEQSCGISPGSGSIPSEMSLLLAASHSLSHVVEVKMAPLASDIAILSRQSHALPDFVSLDCQVQL
eukprot:Gb_02784 [translate_table: standard]